MEQEEVDIRNWIGYVIRKPNKIITRQAPQWSPQVERDWNRPHETWRRNLGNDTKESQVDRNELGRRDI